MIHFVLPRAVENHHLALLPGPPFSAHPQLGPTRVHQAQVHPQAVVGGTSVCLYVGTGHNGGELDQDKVSAAVLQDVHCLGKVLRILRVVCVWRFGARAEYVDDFPLVVQDGVSVLHVFGDEAPSAVLQVV